MSSPGVLLLSLGSLKHPLQDDLEKVQKRASSFVTWSMTGILEQLKWESLKRRRKDSRLIMLYKQCRTQGGGGQKGHMPPPEATTRHTLPPPPPPQKKKLIIELMTPKASFYSNTYAITECKNGRALLKHDNFLP